MPLVLHRNHPKLFHPATTTGFALERAEHVRLDVFDLLGRHVRTLLDGQWLSGNHEIRFDAGDLPIGTYIRRLQAGGKSTSRKMVLVRSWNGCAWHGVRGLIVSVTTTKQV